MSPLDWRGQRVAVWGAGASGIAAANRLAQLGAAVVLSDNRPEKSLEIDGLSPEVAVVGGGNVLAGAAVLVPSPGIKPSTPALVAARAEGVRLVSEIELAAGLARGPIVAISGTDGKSTTTEMIGALVRAGGRHAEVCGNIGTPFTEVVTDDPGTVWVVEVSAFQLWSCGHFRPQVAVVTNVAGDHIDYFDGDMAYYARVKARVFTDQQPGDTALLRAEDPVVSAFATHPGVHRVLFGPSPRATGWGLTEGVLTHDGGPVMAAADLPLIGLHNLANAQAALGAGLALGLPLGPMVEKLKQFKGLPHRIERIGERDGVVWYDDSKATNPHAAAIGLAALPGPLVVITGGYEKGLDLEPFLAALWPRARHVITTGPTGLRTAEAVRGRLPVEHARDMFEAVRQAAAVARPGDQVILAPAASSFDAYRSYAHRGEVFQAAFRALRAS